MNRIYEKIKVIFKYIFVLIFITVCWVGLEYIFEGAVHTSDIDGVIAMILSYFVTDKYIEYL